MGQRVKTKIFFIFLAFFILWGNRQEIFAAATLPRYDNPGQGLYQCHADNVIGPEYIKGGALPIYWGTFQPRDPRTLANPADSLDSGQVNNLINRLRYKKHYLQFVIYIADTPAGQVPFPTWLNIPFINSGGKGIYPSIWSSEYRQRLREFFVLLNAELEKAGVVDNVEYLEMSTGGFWGANDWWLSNCDLGDWLEAAGCSPDDYACFGQKVTEGVNAIIDIYAESFPKFALMMIGGSCCAGQACNYAGFGTILNRYGMRVMTKGAGLGHRTTCGYQPQFGSICGYSASPQVRPVLTKCGQEPWGNATVCKGCGHGFNPCTSVARCPTPMPSQCCDDYATTYQNSLWRDYVSIYCLYSDEITCGDAEVQSTNMRVAQHLGAQIRLSSFNFLPDGEHSVNSTVRINGVWQNEGSVALVAPLKQGLKWTPSSYKVFLEFEKNGTVVYYGEYDFATNPTNTWQPVQNFTERSDFFQFQVPAILGGLADDSRTSYKLYLGLTDPNHENKRFAFINTDSRNEPANRRYLLSDNFVVVGRQVIPTATPTITPTPPPTCAEWTINGRPNSTGDINGDGQINGQDKNLWRTQYAVNLCSGSGCFSADTNHDFKVCLSDLEIWRRNRQ